MRNDYPERDEMNAIQRDRMERRRNTRRKSMVSTAIFAVVVVAVLAAIIFGVVALVNKNKSNTEPTQAATVSATIASGAAPTQPAATQLPSTNADLQKPQATVAANPADPAWQTGETTGSDNSQQETTASGSSTSSQGSYINDDNVYIDRNHPAPKKTGESAEFRFNGAVDGNFYWNYDADNGNIVVSCDYDFTNQQYIFHFYGAAPGVSHVTLYCSDNGVTVPIDLTVNVDDALNVTVG